MKLRILSRSHPLTVACGRCYRLRASHPRISLLPILSGKAFSMTQRSRILRLAAVCLLAAAVEAADERRAPSRVYTNDDLARVSVRGSAAAPEPPAIPPSPAPAEPRPANEGRRESYWRAEAERVRRRVEPWRDQVADLRTEIGARQAAPGVRPYTDPQVKAKQRKLASLEARIREAEDRLEESARRAGALPGWLR
jgi:hypothetical protein